MDIKNTFLYFWCFTLGSDETKKWAERNNFNKQNLKNSYEV